MSISSNSAKIEFRGFDEILQKLTKLEADTKTIAEDALKATHQIITEKARISAQKPNLPRQGKYSHGGTLESLKENAEIKWDGTVGSVEVGFDISHGGLPSVFMIKGDPGYMKNQMMYDAFYGDQVENEVTAKQKEIFYKAMEKFEQ